MTHEDIDDTALSYAEIKMLATGNPYIKEKMDLDIQVNKLKMLKSYYLSQKYDLEDKIIKFYPKEIALQTEKIKGLKADLETQKAHPKEVDDKFVGMTINGVEYADKAEAGKAIIEFCKAKMSADDELMGRSKEQRHITFHSALIISVILPDWITPLTASKSALSKRRNSLKI